MTTIDEIREVAPCEDGLRVLETFLSRGGTLEITPANIRAAVDAGVDVAWHMMTFPRAWIGHRATAIAAERGCEYAEYVDQCPRDDTRAAAIAERRGGWYAKYVDQGPCDDTRAAAIAEERGGWYAMRVDQCARDDTRAAAIAEGRGCEYDLYVGVAK